MFGTGGASLSLGSLAGKAKGDVTGTLAGNGHRETSLALFAATIKVAGCGPCRGVQPLEGPHGKVAEAFVIKEQCLLGTGKIGIGFGEDAGVMAGDDDKLVTLGASIGDRRTGAKTRHIRMLEPGSTLVTRREVYATTLSQNSNACPPY